MAIALRLFSMRYHINSIRYIGEHQIKNIRFRFLQALSWDPRVYCIPATNIDYFLSIREIIGEYNVIELYCHPHYKSGVFLDDSPSYLNHERRTLTDQIESVKKLDNVQIISWEDVKYNV